MTSRKRDDDAAMGCIVFAVLGLILMPLVGLFLVLVVHNNTRVKIKLER